YGSGYCLPLTALYSCPTRRSSDRCDMEKGSLRVDANVSVRPAGSERLGTKTEVKNMNSFANVERALTFEIERQSRVLAEGGTIRSEEHTSELQSREKIVCSLLLEK